MLTNSSRLLDAFRKINSRLNELVFRDSANTYIIYLRSINQCLPSAGVVVDLGAGSVSLKDYLPRVGEDEILLIGLDRDYDRIVSDGRRLNIVANADLLPFLDETVDVITASCFFEHIEYPAGVIQECYRVLKKNGSIVFYTPNARSYVAAIARITPLSFHRCIRMLQTGKRRHEVEVCKTFYRMNTPSDLVRYQGRFSSAIEIYVGAPSYTTFMPPPIHAVFIGVHKVLQKVTWLRRAFGESIIGCLTKPRAQ